MRLNKNRDVGHPDIRGEESRSRAGGPENARIRARFGPPVLHSHQCSLGPRRPARQYRRSPVTPSSTRAVTRPRSPRLGSPPAPASVQACGPRYAPSIPGVAWLHRNRLAPRTPPWIATCRWRCRRPSAEACARRTPATTAAHTPPEARSILPASRAASADTQLTGAEDRAASNAAGCRSR